MAEAHINLEEGFHVVKGSVAANQDPKSVRVNLFGEKSVEKKVSSEKVKTEYQKDKEWQKLKEGYYSLENKHREDNGWPKLKEGYSLKPNIPETDVHLQKRPNTKSMKKDSGDSGVETDILEEDLYLID